MAHVTGPPPTPPAASTKSEILSQRKYGLFAQVPDETPTFNR